MFFLLRGGTRKGANAHWVNNETGRPMNQIGRIIMALTQGRNKKGREWLVDVKGDNKERSWRQSSSLVFFID